MSNQTEDPRTLSLGLAGGIGLIVMMARLAGHRVPAGNNEFGGMQTTDGNFSVLDRKACEHYVRQGYNREHPLTSVEYWKIFDRIERGVKP